MGRRTSARWGAGWRSASASGGPRRRTPPTRSPSPSAISTGRRPRTALGVLSGMPLAALLAAIGGGDGGRLQTIPGVGRNLAERIVVECREGAAALAAGAPRAEAPVGPGGVLGEAVSALVNLGYKRAEAERAVERVKRPAAPLEDVVRAALQGLAG